MPKKRQRLKLKVIDHRRQETTETIETFDHHRSFLRRMRELNDEAAHISEQTVSVVHLYPHTQEIEF
jgi:hypothetical protein